MTTQRKLTSTRASADDFAKMMSSHDQFYLKKPDDEIKIVEAKDSEIERRKGHRKNLSLSEIEGNEDLDYT